MKKYTDPRYSIYRIIAGKNGDDIIGGNILKKNDSDGYPVVSKINSCGDTMWTTLFNGGCCPAAGELFELYENPYNHDILSICYNYNGQPSLLFCLDSNGKYKWTYADSMNISHLLINTDGSIVVAGFKYVYDLNEDTNIYIHSVITLLNKDGMKIWTDIYGRDTHKYGADGLVFHTSDGGYACVHTNYDDSFMREGNFYMVKLNSTGKEEWVSYFGDTSLYEAAFDGIAINDSTYILIGKSGKTDVGAASLHLIKVNSQGKELKVKDYSQGAAFSVGLTARPTSDKKFLICGYACTTLTSAYYTSVLKINENLELDSFYAHSHLKYDLQCPHKIDSTDSIHFMHNYNIIRVDTLHFYTGVKEQGEDVSNNTVAKIFPNPGTGLFALWLNSNTLIHSSLHLRIINALGVEVLQKLLPAGANTYNFDLSGYASGLYFMILEQNGEIITRLKVMKE